MNRRFLVLVLFGISLFLLVSSVSAEDVGSDDSNANIEVFGGEQSIETSEVSSDDANSDISSDNLDNSSENASNNASIDSSKVPSKFSSTKNISSTYGKKPNSL